MATVRGFWHGTLLEGKIDDSGLNYRRNRYYDPASGQFTQEDPIGLAGGLNLYGFAGGDPVNFSDPFGLMPCPPCKRLVLAGARGGAILGSPGGAVGVLVGAGAGALVGLVTGVLVGDLVADLVLSESPPTGWQTRFATSKAEGSSTKMRAYGTLIVPRRTSLQMMPSTVSRTP